MTNDKSQQQHGAAGPNTAQQGQQEHTDQGQRQQTSNDNASQQQGAPDQNETLHDAHSIGYGRSDSGLDTDDTAEE